MNKNESLMNDELRMKIENFIKNLNKKSLMKDDSIIIDLIEFKMMKEIYNSGLIDYREERFINELKSMIQNERFIRMMKNISYYSFREFKNIHFKKLNMRFFYHLNENNLYDLYLSFNLNDRRFKNEKISNLSKIELIKMKNNYSLKEREMKLS
jgi:hypothetical protein